MTRWITSYIDENSERWRKEKLERKKNGNRTAQEWAKLERFEKIRVIQEKLKDNQTVAVNIRPPKIPHSSHQNNDQAEQPSTEDNGEWPPHGQAEPQHSQNDQEMDLHEQTEQPCTSTSSSTSSPPPDTRQPLTIPRAVVRCVPVQYKDIISLSLTSHTLGITNQDADQAEQPEDTETDPEKMPDSKEDSQAEPRDSQTDQAKQPEQGEDQAEKTEHKDKPPPVQTDSKDDIPCKAQGQRVLHVQETGQDGAQGQAEEKANRKIIITCKWQEKIYFINQIQNMVSKDSYALSLLNILYIQSFIFYSLNNNLFLLN